MNILDPDLRRGGGSWLESGHDSRRFRREPASGGRALMRRGEDAGKKSKSDDLIRICMCVCKCELITRSSSKKFSSDNILKLISMEKSRVRDT